MKHLIILCLLSSGAVFAKSAQEAGLLRTVLKNSGTYWGFQCLKKKDKMCTLAQLVSFKGSLKNVRDLKMESGYHQNYTPEIMKDRFRVAGGEFSYVYDAIDRSQFTFTGPFGAFYINLDGGWQVLQVPLVFVFVPAIALDLFTLPWRAIRKGKMLKAQRKLRDTDIVRLFMLVDNKKDYTVIKVPGKKVFKTLKKTLLNF